MANPTSRTTRAGPLARVTGFGLRSSSCKWRSPQAEHLSARRVAPCLHSAIRPAVAMPAKGTPPRYTAPKASTGRAMSGATSPALRSQPRRDRPRGGNGLRSRTEPIQHLYNEAPVLLVATQGERLADVDETDPGAIPPACRAEVPLVLQEVPQRLVDRSVPVRSSSVRSSPSR